MLPRRKTCIPYVVVVKHPRQDRTEGIVKIGDLSALGVQPVPEFRIPYAVYFLLDGDEVVYVGKSTEVTHRIYCHKNDPRKQFDKAVYMTTATEYDMNVTEAAFILHFKPRLNNMRSGAPKHVHREGIERVLIKHGFLKELHNG